MFLINRGSPRCLGLLLPLLLSAPAMALTADKAAFSGFASITYAKAVSDKKEGDWYGISDNGEYRDLNVLGLRLDTDLTENIKFGAQLVSSGRNNYDPEFDWIYASMDLTNELNVAVGKMRAPLFNYSDFLDVRYAYQWIQPPKAVYDVPFSSVEGIKASYVKEVGQWTTETLFWYGTAEDDFYDVSSGFETTIEGKVDYGFALTVDRDWFSVRGLYMEGELGADISPLTNIVNQQLFSRLAAGIDGYANNPALELGLNAQVPGLGTAVKTDLLARSATFKGDLAALNNSLLWDTSPASFYSLGTSLDFETVFVVAEATRIEINEPNLASAREVDSAYLMLGTRIIEKWSFSITATWDKDKEHSVLYEDLYQAIAPFTTYNIAPGVPLDLISGLDVNGLPIAGSNGTNDFIDMGYSAAADGFRDKVQSVQAWETTGYIFTVRWDVMNSTALKLEYIDEKQRHGTDKELRPRAFLFSVDLVF